MFPNKDEVTGVVSVLSGGLDSTTMTYKLVDLYGADKVFALSFTYGQKQIGEIEYAKKTCEKLGIAHKVIDISFFGDIVAPMCTNISTSDIDMPTITDVLGDPQPPTYVPYRNMILNSVAFSFAEVNDCNYIAMGLQVHDEYNYWDTSQMFVDNMNAVSHLNRLSEISIIAPFGNTDKVEEIKIGLELGVDYKDTLSCYQPDVNDVACGTCASCAERINAWQNVGVKDPLNYAVDIRWNFE